MRTLLIITFFFPLFLWGQNFQLLGTDPADDDIGNIGMDLMSVSIAIDKSQDSIWIKFTSFDDIQEDWGFFMLFDTNLVPRDGKSWNYSNPAGNNDLTYDLKLDVMNNQHFPPTHTIFYDTSGQKFTQDIVLTHPNKNNLIVRMKLSDVDPDGDFNLIAAGGQFDGITNDNLPDAGYLEHRASSTSVEPIEVSEVSVYPNPTSGAIFIRADKSFEFSILDFTGKELFRSNTSTGKADINLTQFKTGIYLLRLKSNDNIFIQKIYKL